MLFHHVSFVPLSLFPNMVLSCHSFILTLTRIFPLLMLVAKSVSSAPLFVLDISSTATSGNM